MILWILYLISLIYPFCDAQPAFVSCNQSTIFTDCQAVTFPEELLPGTVINTYTFSDPSVSSLTFKITPFEKDPIVYLSILSRPFQFDLIVASRIDKEAFSTSNKQLNFYLEVNGKTLNIFNFYVTIIDIDDNYPMFERPSVICPMVEKDISQMCLNLTVTDADQINSFCMLEVLYVSSGSIYDFVLNITTTTVYGTGYKTKFQIYLKKPLLYKENPLRQLQIQARDSANHVSLGNIIITITEIATDPPVFLKSTYSVQINESLKIGTSVVTVTAEASDKSIDGPVVYSLKSDNKFNQYFNIGPSTGTITLSQIIKSESPNISSVNGLLKLFVVATVSTPSPSRSSEALVQIQIMDINDSPAIFGQSFYQGSIPENSIPGTSVYTTEQIFVDDADFGLNAQYTLTVKQNNSISNFFEIYPISGMNKVYLFIRLKNGSSLDYELIQFISVTIEARQSAPVVNISDTSKTDVSISIINMNDNIPVFSNSTYKFTIKENSPKFTPIGTIIAIDKDLGIFGQITYSLNDPLNKFAINSTSGLIYVNVNADQDLTLLDRELYPYLSAVAVATDGGGLTTVASVIITLQDVNDNPPVFDLPLYQIWLTENSLNFSPKPMKVKNSVGINETNGILFVQSPLDSEKTSKLIYQVRVVDLAAETPLPLQTAFASLEINVVDFNDNSPVFQSSAYFISLYENFPAMSNVSTGATGSFVYVTDVDTIGPPWFNNSDPTNTFSVDPNTGQIILIKSLDRETMAFINFTVWCNDGVFSVNTTVMVAVLDVNDNAPYFVDNITLITISEDAQVGSTISQFTANDLDSGEFGRVVFFMDVNSKFTLTPDGMLILTRSLTIDQIFQYKIRIQIMDNPNGNVHLNNSKEVIINILEVNSHYPTFEKTFYEFTPIYETEGIGHVIGEIVATDKDRGENGNVTYKILLPDSDANPMVLVLFNLQNVAGKAQIIVHSSLSRKGGRYVGIGRAMDNGVPRLYNNCTFVITIIDFNSFAPNFTNPDLSAAGNSTPRYLINKKIIGVITTIAAFDADSGVNGEIRFDIVPQNGDDEFFFITPATGNLTNIRKFDQEKKDLYKIRIVAYDLGSPSLSSFTDIEIAVLDQDDHLPVFPVDSQNMNFSVFEGSQMFSSINNTSLVGFKIGNVGKAIDLDIGDNALIVYLFIGDTSLFYLDPYSADLYGLKEFDRETVDHYNAKVKAIPESQYGEGPHSVLSGFSIFNASESNILIIILDINDNPPEFTTQKIIGTITPSSISGSLIVDISKYAFDKDLVSKNNLSFYIVKILPIENAFAQNLPTLNIGDILVLNSTGHLSRALGVVFQKNIQGHIEMTVGVSDGKFEATTQCIIYFVNQNQRLIIVIKNYPSVVKEIADELINYLSYNTGLNIRWDAIELTTDTNGYIVEGVTNLYILAINTNNNTIIDGTYLLTQIDQKASQLSDLYKKYKISEVKLATSNSTSPPESGNFYKLILIIFVCCVGILLIILVIFICICRSKYQKKLKAYSTSSIDNSEVKNPSKFPGTNYYEDAINPFSETMPPNSVFTSPNTSKGMKKIGVPVYGNDASFDELYPNLPNSTFKEATETGL